MKTNSLHIKVDRLELKADTLQPRNGRPRINRCLHTRSVIYKKRDKFAVDNLEKND